MALPEGPQSRAEQYLARIAGQVASLPEAPRSRVEQYLDYIAENGILSKEELAEKVSDWLEENIHEDPTVVIDSSLSVSGAAADAKAVGDEIVKSKDALDRLNSTEIPLGVVAKTGGGVEFTYDDTLNAYRVYTATVVTDRSKAWKNLLASSSSLAGLTAGKEYYIDFSKSGNESEGLIIWIRFYLNGSYSGPLLTLDKSGFFTVPDWATGVVVRILADVENVPLDCYCYVSVQNVMSNKALQDSFVNAEEELKTIQPELDILTLGDSIAMGARNSGRGFVGDLGMPYVNIAVSGASISTVRTSYKNIFTQLTDHAIANPEYYPDVIVANGGINDYISSAPMGTVPSEPVGDDESAELLDKSTVMGATSYLFYQMIKLYPRAQRFFVIMHKVKRGENNVYYPTHTRPGQNYTQQDLHDKLVELCNVYNVNVIDVYKDSMLNTFFSQYVSPTAYSSDHSVTDLYFVDNDGLHPLALGYKEAYVPLVRKALRIGTKK